MQSWIPNEDLLSQIDSFQASCLRIMNNISSRDHVSNLTLLESVNETPLSEIGPGAPAAVAGPPAAAPYIRSSPAILLLGAISGQTTSGGKRTTYREYIASVFSQEHPPTEAEIRRATGEREDWRSCVAACGRPWWPSRPRFVCVITQSWLRLAVCKWCKIHEIHIFTFNKIYLHSRHYFTSSNCIFIQLQGIVFIQLQGNDILVNCKERTYIYSQKV